MKHLLQIAAAALMTSFAFGAPTPALAQGELSQCGAAPKARDFPCQMVGRVARNAAEFKVLSLIRSGRAKTIEQARTIANPARGLPACGPEASTTPLPCKLGQYTAKDQNDWFLVGLMARGKAKNRAEAQAILDARRATRRLPTCGNRANATPLPCRVGDYRVVDKEDWNLVRLITTGKARNRAEARALVAKRREIAAAALPQCGAKAKTSPVPCQMGKYQVKDRKDWQLVRLIVAGVARDRADAAAIIAERRAARTPAALPACGPKANSTPLPCAMAGYNVKSKEDWRVVRLVAIGKAQSINEARAILATRDAIREAKPQNLPACKGNAGKATVPCAIGQRIARSAEEIRIFRLIEQGRARNVAQAQDLLAQRRAEAARAAAAKTAAAEARRQQRIAERRAARAAAAAAAAAATDRSRDRGITRIVTGTDVRASDEEYGARVVTNDSGLSKFEKALLLGLGAVVVGKVLKNGDKVVSNSGDRVVVQSPEGDLRVLKDDDTLIQRPGDAVQTRTYDDGSTRTMVTKPDGSRVITVRSADGAVLRRVNIDAGGTPTVIIDDTRAEQAVNLAELPPVIDGARQASLLQSESDLARALSAQLRVDGDRRFSLRQVREITQVRALAPQLELDAIRFATGSAAILPEQARALARIGGSLRDLIQSDPRTVILVEGHTDATGSASYNLALSDRRAETVALALTEYFDVPPSNLVTQGYGEDALKVPTLLSEAANRRAVVRNITGLLQ